MNISADDVTGDGPAGKDNITSDVEVLAGTTFADTLSAGPLDSTLGGNDDDDRLAGGPGDDVIEAALYDDGNIDDQGKDTVTCGGGNDTIRANADFNEDIVAGEGSDRVIGADAWTNVTQSRGRVVPMHR